MATREKLILQLQAEVGNIKKDLEEVKQKTKDVSTEAQSATDDFGFMGVTVGSLKGAFTKVMTTSKAMFSSIKAGIASTGIGLLVLAIGTLITHFTTTKKGAEQLEVAFNTVSAAIDVIRDRISSVGSAIVKVFKGDFKGAAEEARNAVQGIGEEIRKETKLLNELTKASQVLRDSQRELNVETARRRSELEELKLIAEDTTKSESERLSAAEKALNLETTLLEKRVSNAEEALRIRREEIAASESTAEDLDELAQLEIDLFNIRQESTTKQIELNNKINSIRKEGEAARQAEIDEQIKLDEEAAAKQEEVAKRRLEIQQELSLSTIESERQVEIMRATFAAERIIAETEDAETIRLLREKLANDINAINKKFDEQDQAIDDANTQQKQDNAAKLASDRKQLADDTLNGVKAAFGEESAAGKAASAIQATINTYEGISAALAYGPIGIPLAAVVAAAGFKNVAEIMSTPTPELAMGGIVGGYGTGTSDSVNARLSKGESVINARSTRMFKPLLSAINEQGGGRAFADSEGTGGMTAGVVKAFVVADDMTNQQNQLDKIRRKTTI